MKVAVFFLGIVLGYLGTAHAAEEERRSGESAPPVMILSISGGGVRGVIPAVLLHAIEKETKTPISKLFDVIVGTSTGGLLALALTTPKEDDHGKPRHSAEELVRFYKEKSKTIFPAKGWCDQLCSLCKTSLYNPEPFERIAEELLGTTRMDGLLGGCTVGVTAMGVNECEARVFRSDTDGSYLIRDMARATSAAPGYFPPAVIGNASFCDGGLGFNNPAGLAHDIAKKKYPGRLIRLISIGTGYARAYENTRDVQRKCRPCWVKEVIEMQFAAQDEGTHKTVHDNLKDNYTRLNVNLAEAQMPMDKHENVEGLEIVTNAYIRKELPEFQKAVEWCRERAERLPSAEGVSSHRRESVDERPEQTPVRAWMSPGERQVQVEFSQTGNEQATGIKGSSSVLRSLPPTEFKQSRNKVAIGLDLTTQQ